MRKMNVEEFKNDYEYEQAKKDQRKREKQSRNQKRGRKDQWQAADV